MKKQLSPEQIEELHEYCYFRSVFHYDVQIELVDHLALAIEKLWETDPELSFFDAVCLVGEQFGGDLGFYNIKKEKEKAIKKKYRRYLLQFVGEFYKFPKIVITILLTFIIFLTLQIVENDQWISKSLAFLLVAFTLVYRLYYFPKYVYVKVKKGYAFLFNEVFRSSLLSKSIFYIPIILLNSTSHKIHFSNTASIVFSVFVSFYLVLLYADCFYIPTKIREQFEEQFPQFVIS